MASPNQPNRVEDIFGAVDERPTSMRQRAATPSDDTPPAGRVSQIASFAWWRNSRLLLVVVGVLVVGILVVTLLRLGDKTTEGNVNTSSASGANVTAAAPSANVDLSTVPSSINLNRSKDVATADGDHDGLTSAEEVSAQTSPDDPDTDKDGLTDYQELRIYHSNPLNPDTDGDGFTDGREVSTGNNPLGSGRLTQ